jgi:flagellar biosynthesis/type III secretory pathway M-ring protein FliF/YscJ
MRTSFLLSLSAAMMWLRTSRDRVRRVLLSRRPVVRWGLFVAAALIVVAAGYWAVILLVPVGTRSLTTDRPLRSDDLIKVCRALRAKSIEYHIGDGRRVEVPDAQFDAAVAVLAKLELGLPPIDEIRSQSSAWSLLESHEEKAQRQLINRERLIESFISELKGLVSSVVSLKYLQKPSLFHTPSRLSAFVFVEPEQDRPIPFQTVQSIVTTLLGCEPELTPESITIVDSRGHPYLEAGKPGLSDLSRNRARAEEVQQDILDKLAVWIKGVQVWVELIDSGPSEPAAALAKAAPGQSSGAALLPTVGVNHPLELNPESPPATLASSVAATKVATRLDLHERGRILIYVPRSFYYNAVFPRADRRVPTADEFQRMAARTKEQVLKVVHLMVPESWVVDVDTIPDDVPPMQGSELPSAADSRRKALDWAVLAAAGAAVALLTAVGSWIQVSRRPAAQAEQARETRQFRARSAAEEGSSERVHELVQRDPEAAASVLQRWASEGGRPS